MSRIIKFRAWHNVDLKMYYNDSVTIGIGGHVYFLEPSGEWEQDDDRSIITLMQHTGLKDKNGIEIYEGDIVKGNRTPDNFNDSSVFYNPPYYEYREVKFEITKNSISINLPTDITYAERNNPISWEVVGNIHEHKHLLENNSQPK